jgi:hypothetical protein
MAKKITSREELKTEVMNFLNSNNSLEGVTYKFKKQQDQIIDDSIAVIAHYIIEEKDQFEGAIPGFIAGKNLANGKKKNGLIVISKKRVFITGFFEKMIDIQKKLGFRSKSNSETH